MGWNRGCEDLIDIFLLKDVTLKLDEIKSCIEDVNDESDSTNYLESYIGNSAKKNLSVADVEALGRLFGLLIEKVINEAVVNE
jgi:hypothetical protein